MTESNDVSAPAVSGTVTLPPNRLIVGPLWSRPTSQEIEAFRGVPTGNICDAMGQVGGMSPAVAALTTRTSFVGSALTVTAGPQDVLGPYASVKFAVPGDVIVVATNGYTGAAVLGDKLAGYMCNAGVAAFVTDGVARDLADIDALGLPTFGQGLTPNGSAPIGPSTIGFRICLAGVTVDPGDLVVGDRDGVVVVPVARIAEVGEALVAIQAKDAERDALIAQGVTVPPWLEELLRTDAVSYARGAGERRSTLVPAPHGC